MITEVSPSNNVVLDANGNGQCALGPPSGTKWALRLATVATSTASKQPQAKLYRGSPTGPLQLIDNTYTGSSASSGKVGGAIYYPGQVLWAVWTGGDPGATATLQVFGQQGGRTDPLPLSPTGEGFANPIVSQVIVGTPGGPEIVIGVAPIPAELVAYYQAAPVGTNPETVVGATINYDGAGNYAYQAMVIDSGAPKVTSLVVGASVAGVVNEASRFALNPGMVLGNARFQQFFEECIALFTSATGATTVAATQAVADAFHRWSLNRDGTQGWGGGAALTDCYLSRTGVGMMELGQRLDLRSFGVAGDTMFAVFLDGDANPRRSIRAGGEMRGGDGTAGTDTTHYRDSAAVWASDDIKWNNAGAGETWHAMTLTGGWANFAGADVTAQYRRVAAPANCVQIVGVIAGGTKTDGTTIFTLPAGYRPAHTVIVPATYDGTAVAGSPRLAIASTGAITVNGVSAVTTLSALEFNAIIPLDA